MGACGAGPGGMATGLPFSVAHVHDACAGGQGGTNARMRHGERTKGDR